MGRNYKDFSGDKNPNYKTGLATKGARPSFYNSWQNMKQRCLNPRHPKYHRYGGRGIKICDEWMTIEGFSDWARKTWKEGYTIDRIDNDGDYEPKNCRWITASENSKKKSTTKISPCQAAEIRVKLGKGESLSSLAKEYNVNDGTIWFIKNNITHVTK